MTINNDNDDFVRRIEALDLSLFDALPTESDEGDRRLWLTVQRSIRHVSLGYTYLEIGSHLGGSIQQHLLDPLCRRIISIDKRPSFQPDDRGERVYYEENCTDRMLDNLRKVAPEQLGKIVCFDADARDLDPRLITEPPQFCFIDGEHTKAAVLSDFEFCLRVCDPNGAICFHDAWVIHPALTHIVSSLANRGIQFTARKLSATFCIFLGKCSAAHDDVICSSGDDGLRWLRLQRLRTFVKRVTPKWLHSTLRRFIQT